MADHKHHSKHRGGGHAHDATQPNGQSNGQANGHAQAEDVVDTAPQAETAVDEQPQEQQPAAQQQETGGGGDASAELQQVRERHLRLAAEFDNYRKRVERERGESWVRAQAELAQRLLEPLDDLQRIADFDPATTNAQALHEGAEMVEKKFFRALESAGLEVIDAAGKPFDPTQHEALTMVPAENEDEDDTVAQVYRKGYRFKGVLLRPAQVVVKKHG
ncbi:MAG TPA: nucleotide exchange factor GrpE [Longimicrobium sp.]|nr:nucleotide exchange factor GrpE [Longimicrobium sp.]